MIDVAVVVVYFVTASIPARVRDFNSQILSDWDIILFQFSLLFLFVPLQVLVACCVKCGVVVLMDVCVVLSCGCIQGVSFGA